MFRAPAHYQGVAMIEVLIAALIITSSILALLQMQVSALRQVYMVEHRQLLLWLADDLVERVRSHPDGFRTLDLASSPENPDLQCSQTDPCSGHDFARWQFADWQAAFFQAIPDGEFHILRSGGGQAPEFWKLTMRWFAEQEGDGIAEVELEFML